MVYERLMDSTETSDMQSHVLTFLRSCMIGQWRLNNAKPFLAQAKFFGMPPPDARRWEQSRLSQIFPTYHMVTEVQQGPTPTGPQQRPTNHQHIPPLQMNTAGIPVYQLYASAIQSLLSQETLPSVGDTQGNAQ